MAFINDEIEGTDVVVDNDVILDTTEKNNEDSDRNIGAVEIVIGTIVIAGVTYVIKKVVWPRGKALFHAIKAGRKETKRVFKEEMAKRKEKKDIATDVDTGEEIKVEVVKSEE